MKKKELVPVDIGRLSHGLNTTFRGVAEIFDAIGAEEKPGFGVVEEVKDTEDSKAVSSGKDGTDEVQSGTEASDHISVNKETHPESAAEEGDSVAEADSESAGVEASDGGASKGADKKAIPATMLTVDDLMKVAAAKIKMNPKNSDKIGSLVKAYGKTTLKDIPPEKMEEFMTDLSNI